MADNGESSDLQQEQIEVLPYRESISKKVAFLVTVTLLSMVTGFGLNLGLAGRRYRRSLKNKPGEAGHEDPVLLATRALGWGTAYAVAGTGGLVLAGTGVWTLLNRSVALQLLHVGTRDHVQLVLYGP